MNFLEQTEVFDGDIITNPPFKYVSQFITKGLELIPNGRKLILFLRIQCLEGVGRYKIYKDSPPKYIYVASRRIACAKNAEFTTMDRNAACYCWFVWEKGFRGEPTVRWFNTGNDNDCVAMENNDVG